jgi:hypothetical protein
LTTSSGTFGHLRGGGGLFDRLDELADASANLAGGVLEGGQGFLVASGFARGVGDAPMHQLDIGAATRSAEDERRVDGIEA